MTRKNKIIITICILVGCISIIGFRYIHHPISYQSPTEVNNAVVITNTTWELVEHTQGQTIDNLTGTDWNISFNEQSGTLTLCDTYPFNYFVHRDTITFDFSTVAATHCQNTSQTKESRFVDFLKQSLQIERLESPDSHFKEVLTFSHGNEKLVFISTTEKKNLQNKTKNITLYTDAVYTGMFTVTPFNTDTGTVGTVSSTVTTNEQGMGMISLPVGTYQISLAQKDPRVTVLPSVFSVTDSQSKQMVTLSVKKNN